MPEGQRPGMRVVDHGPLPRTRPFLDQDQTEVTHLATLAAAAVALDLVLRGVHEAVARIQREHELLGIPVTTSHSLTRRFHALQEAREPPDADTQVTSLGTAEQADQGRGLNPALLLVHVHAHGLDALLATSALPVAAAATALHHGVHGQVTPTVEVATLEVGQELLALLLAAELGLARQFHDLGTSSFRSLRLDRGLARLAPVHESFRSLRHDFRAQLHAHQREPAARTHGPDLLGQLLELVAAVQAHDAVLGGLLHVVREDPHPIRIAAPAERALLRTTDPAGDLGGEHALLPLARGVAAHRQKSTLQALLQGQFGGSHFGFLPIPTS